MNKDDSVPLDLDTREWDMVVGAVLMYEYVPFHRVSKKPLSKAELACLKRIRERSLDRRNALRKGNARLFEVIPEMTTGELMLMIEILKIIIAEAPGDLYVHIAPLDEVKSLHKKLSISM